MAQACSRPWPGRSTAGPASPTTPPRDRCVRSRHPTSPPPIATAPGEGCLLAALGSDASRQAAPVRRTVTEGLRCLVAALAKLIPGRSEAVKRERALATFASLVGAIVLARAVDDAALSDEILKAVSATVSGPARSKS